MYLPEHEHESEYENESETKIYKIRCFSCFTSSEDLKKEYEMKCLNFINPIITSHYGINQKYFFTSGEDYTHVIIFNTAMPNISHIPKENVIGFACEPLQYLMLTHEFVDYARKYIHRYYVGDKYNLPEPFTEGYGFLLCYVPPQLNINPKNKFMSIMVSQKTDAPGHKYRHELTKAILNTSLPIDIYGNGCDYYTKTHDNRVKGKFDSNEVLYDGYIFTISIENFQCNHYFSEKIVNPLLSKTTPLYLGCRNIDNYFPEMYNSLHGDITEDMQLLHDIYKNPDKYIRNIDLSIVDNKMNLIANLPRFFP